MTKLLSIYVWAWKNYTSVDFSLGNLRKFYPDCDIFINVDYEGDYDNYKVVAEKYNATLTKNNFQVGYCGDFGNIKVGKLCWSKEETFEWIRGLYEACLKSTSTYMLLLEEDDFILKPLSILEYDFSMAIHASTPSAAGNYRPNYLPEEFMEYSHRIGGVSTAPGYGAGGGCIFKPNEFIKSWKKCKDTLWYDYDQLKQINKIIGWQDFITQFVMMIGGYNIVQNFNIAQPWEDPNWMKGRNYLGEEYEMVCGLKDHTVLR